MIAIADTSPLNYLIQIDAIDLLPILFGEVVVPHVVVEELHHPNTPPKVRGWILHPPDWLIRRTALKAPNPVLLRLDAGEREAIQVALESNIGVVLMEEAEGRQVAESLGLEVRGTLGILERGAKLGQIDLHKALHQLDQTNFRISPEVRAVIAKRNR